MEHIKNKYMKSIIVLLLVLFFHINIYGRDDKYSDQCVAIMYPKLKLKLNEVFTDSCKGKLLTKAIGLESDYILWEHYDINTNTITTRYTSIKGKYIGWSILYLPEGSEEGAYINGKQDGLWIVRDKMNKIIQYKLYKKNKLINYYLKI